MQNRNSIDVTHTLKRGMNLYKTTWSSFAMYAFLAILFSFIDEIYVEIFDTFFTGNELIYIAGLVFLILLSLPLIYYSIRIVMTNVAKLKSLILMRSMDYKSVFKENKDKFWRVLLILIIRFVFKAIAIGSIAIPVVYIYVLLNPHQSNLVFTLWGLGIVIPISVCTLVLSAYMLIRIQFATLIIYWDIESPESDLKTSLRMTKYQLFDKMKIMFAAHLPGMILFVIGLIYLVMNIESLVSWMRWAYIVISIVVNTALFSWMYCLYYPLFEQMKMFSLEKNKTIDADGREWSTY